MKIPPQLVSAVLLCCSLPLGAQEVGYLNLVGIAPRTRLRAPAPPPPVCNENGCSVSGGVGGGSIGCGIGSPNDPRALKTTLMFLDKLTYSAADSVEIELRIENVGTVSMEIPWSPHLADLQPADQTVPFSYTSLDITLLLRNRDEEHDVPAIARLFGNPEHRGTLLVLKPGESVRLRLQTALSVPVTKIKDGDLWSANVSSGLRSEKFVPHVKYGGFSTDVVNLYPRQLSGAPMALEIEKPEVTLNPASANH
jgi:hypothetical protein